MRQIDLEQLLEGNEVLQELSNSDEEIIVVIRIPQVAWYDYMKVEVGEQGEILKEYRIVKAGK